MIQAMLLGGLRRGEVLGLRLGDLRLGDWRVFIADGKGGHQRLVPVSQSFFGDGGGLLERSNVHPARPRTRVRCVKGAAGANYSPCRAFKRSSRRHEGRAGLAHGTCHELRHTCFTRLREAGMAIEAIQAQAGHRSITSTRVYLHLGDDWPADEYRRAAEAIEAQALMGVAQ